MNQPINKHGKQLKKLLQRKTEQSFSKQNTSQNYMPRYSYADKNTTQEVDQQRRHFDLTYEKKDAQIKILNKENYKLRNQLELKKQINQELLKNLEEIAEYFLKREVIQKQNFQTYQSYIINNFQNLINNKSQSLYNKPLFKEAPEFPKKVLSKLITKNQRKINSLSNLHQSFELKTFQKIQNYLKLNRGSKQNLEGSLPPQEININFPESQYTNIQRKKSIISSYQSFDLTDVLQKHEKSFSKETNNVNLNQDMINCFDNLKNFDFNILNDNEIQYIGSCILDINANYSKKISQNYQLKGIKNQLSSFNEKIQYKYNQIDELQYDIDKIQKEHLNKKKENQQLNKNLKDLKNQWKDIISQKEELQSVNKDLSQQIREKQKLIKKEQMLKNYQQHSFQRSIDQMKQFEDQIQVHKNNILEQSQDLSDRQEEIYLNELKIKELQQKINNIKQQKQSYDDELQQQQNIIKQLNKENQLLEEDRLKYQTQFNKIQKQKLLQQKKQQQQKIKIDMIKKKLIHNQSDETNQTDISNKKEEIKEIILRIMNRNLQAVPQQNFNKDFEQFKQSLKSFYQNLKKVQKIDQKQLQNTIKSLNLQLCTFNKILNKNQMEEQMLQKEIKYLKKKQKQYKTHNESISRSLQQKNQEFLNVSQNNLKLKSESINMIKNEIDSLKNFSQNQQSYKDQLENNYQHIKDICQEEKDLKLNLSNIDRQNSTILDTSQRESFLRKDSTTDLLSQLNKLQVNKDISVNSISYQSNPKSFIQNNKSNSILQGNQNPILKKNLSSASQMQLNTNQSFMKKKNFGDELEKNWDKFVKILKKVLNCLFKSSCIISNTLTILVCKKDSKNHIQILKKKIIGFLKDSVKKHKTSIAQVKGYQNLQKLSYEAFYSILMKFLRIVQEESSKQETFNIEIKNLLA